jgi:hypothetical protein
MHMTPELFLKCSQRGEIPVPVIQLGDRGIWHCDAKAFLDYMGADAPQSLVNLF